MTKVSETKKQKTPVKESQQRGTVLFPLQYNYCNTANPFYDLWLHWHTEFEIIHVVSGCYRIFINDHEILLNEGDVCLVPGKVVHGDAPDKGVGKFESAVFDIELMRLHGFSPDAFISEIVNGTITIENVYRLNECKDISRTVTSFFEAIPTSLINLLILMRLPMLLSFTLCLSSFCKLINLLISFIESL